MATLQDLLSYASSNATIRRIDYFDPRYARPDEIRAWQGDKRKRDRQRLAVLKAWPGRCRSSSTEALVPGTYYGTRLIISADGSIDYIPGQYEALEIWQAVGDYMHQTNNIEA